MTASFIGEDYLEIRNLSVSFDGFKAIDGVDLTLMQGRLHFLIGPNGAGKTTLIRHCTGLLAPDEGRITVAGVDLWADPLEAKRRIGLVPDTPVLFDRLSARELLEYNGLLRSMDPDVVHQRSEELLDVLGLTDDADTLVADFSLGMTKKIALAAALLHSPRVLFLDEPFGAIDPVSTQAIEFILHRFVAAGGTVVFSSHVMDVVERLCDRIVIIHGGRVLVDGRIADITGGRRLQDVFVDLVGGDPHRGHEDLGWFASS